VKIDFQRALAAPEGAQEVILVRHGACDPPATVGDLISGRSDPSLNERGLKEAAAVTLKLSGLEIGAIFATPLRRTSETAAATAAATGLEPEILDDLVEVYLGEWEGPGIHQRGARGDAEFVRVMREQRWELIPGAEPAAEFATRVRRGLERRRVHPLGGDRRVPAAGERQRALRLPAQRQRLLQPAVPDARPPLGSRLLQRDRPPPRLTPTSSWMESYRGIRGAPFTATAEGCGYPNAVAKSDGRDAAAAGVSRAVVIANGGET
jgi:2,3-bisphosphoglycerate-dependent phosphoglycerate mutase